MKNLIPILKINLTIVFFVLFTNSFGQIKKQPIIPYQPKINVDPIQGCSIFSQSNSLYECGSSFVFAAPVDNNFYTFPPNANLGCLSTAPNQTWFLVTINSLNSSTLTFVQDNSSGVDVDAAIYGPIQNNDISFACSSVLNPPLSCDFDFYAQSVLTINNAQVGQKYLMVVTNYSNYNTNITITQPSGGNVTYCKSNFTNSAPCTNNPISTLTGNNVITEGQSSNLLLSYSGPAPLSYEITGIGSGIANTNPFTISISPTETKNYKLINASNSCGNQSVTGQPTIVVQSPTVLKKLVSCFPFDGNFLDQKGVNTITNHNAIITVDRNGMSNSAYFFNGSSYLNVSTNELLNNEFTYSAWIKPSILPSVGNYQSIFSIGDIGGDQTFGISYDYNISNGRPKWILGNYINYNQVGPLSYSEELIVENQWYHIAAVRTRDSLKIFVNGVLSLKAYSGGNYPYYSGNIGVIGARYNGTQNFIGTLDDVKIFKSGLSNEEVKMLFLNNNCEFEFLENRKEELIACFPLSGNTIDQIYSNNGFSSSLIPTSDRFGNVNSAYSFDGTNDINLDPRILKLNSFSYSIWVKPTYSDLENTILSIGSGADLQKLSFINNSNSSFVPSFQFSSSIVSGGNAPNILFQNVVINQWYHIVAIREPSKIRLYVNGILVGEKSCQNYKDANYGIGSIFANIGSNNGNLKFKGVIDDIKIFNGPLSNSEAKAMFLESGGNCIFNKCPIYLKQTLDIADIQTKNASFLLDATNSILGSAKVDYLSERNIVLLPGFKTNPNSVFKAEIRNCRTDFNPVLFSSLILQPGPSDGQDSDVNSLYPNTVSFGGNGKYLAPSNWTYSGTPNIKRAYIKFDLNSLPTTAIIDSAYLDLFFSQDYVNSYPFFSGQTGHYGNSAFYINRALNSWNESTLIWNNKPSVSNINTVSVPAAINPTQNFQKIDIKNLLIDIINNTNYGFEIKMQDETPYNAICLTSSEETNPSIRPRLTIYYH